jgi:peptidyl-prolyl cis-trans isomerase SurA
MKLKYFISALVVAGIACGAYAAKDPVLMKINNKEVKVSEFEYLYKKNLEQQVNKESLDEYVDRFVNYKLKVAEAERLGYDTLPRIKSELEGYRNDMLAPYLTDMDLKEQLVNEAYDRMTKNVNISHLMLARGKDDAENAQQLAKMDSIRTCILNGEDFNDMVMKYSIDRSKVNNKGDYGYITSGVFPYAFEYEAFNTPVGEMSKPFVTDYGIHLIKVNGVRPDDGQVEVGHILLLFPKEVTDSAKFAVKNRIDSIYNRVQAGDEFEALAKKFSQDPGSARNDGKLPGFGRGRMVKPFEDACFSLKEGEISQPIETKYGYHIIKKYRNIPVPTFEEARPKIDLLMKADERSTMPADSKLKQIKSQLNYKVNDKLGEYLKKELEIHGGYDSTFVTDVVAKSDFPLFTFDKDQTRPLSLMAKMLNTKAKYANNDIAAAELVANVDRISRKEIVSYYAENLIELNPDYRNLMNEYREGTLLFEVMNNEVWNKAKSDEKALVERFNANRSKYQWDAPHFKGIMVCGKNDSIINEVKAAMQQLDGEPEDSITTAMNKKFGRNIRMVRVVTKQGENAMVDHIAFGGKQVESIYNGYPVYSILFGKIISQPEEMSDVKGLVASDYQDVLEEEWIQELHKRYKVNIDKKQLKALKSKYK